MPTADTGCPEAVRIEIAKLGGMLARWLKDRDIDPVNVRASELIDKATDELGALSLSLEATQREQMSLPLSEREPLTWPDLDEYWREAAKFARDSGAAEELAKGWR